MDIDTFIAQQEQPAAQTVFGKLHRLIQKHDPKVQAQIGTVMGKYQGITYEEEGVFKYGLNITKNHFSYHSMVMYAYPDILSALKERANKVKFQKGCLNFNSLEDIPLETFEQFLEVSAQQDFSPVVARYKKKK